MKTTCKSYKILKSIMKILLAAQTLDFLGKLYEKHNISDNIVM